MISRQHVNVPSINDPNSGFQLVTSFVDELAEISSLYSESNYQKHQEISGSIQFAVWYRNDEQILYVKIVGASNLAAEMGKTLNPYVKVHLLPHKSKHTKRKTGIQRKTIDPEFNETVKYKMSAEELDTTTVWLSVWDWDVMGRNRFLGEVLKPLFEKSVDLSSSKDVNYKLKDHEKIGEIEETGAPPGKLRIALKYEFLSTDSGILSQKHSLSALHAQRAHSASPEPFQRFDVKGLKNRSSSLVGSTEISTKTSATSGILHICVMNAEDLPPTDATGDTNPFVRCFLLPNTGLNGKRKTSVVAKSLNPVWDEECSYNFVKFGDLQTHRVLEMSVYDSDRRGSNSFIGGLRLGPAPDDGPEWIDSTAEEFSHWEEVFDNPGTWVEHIHTLRPSMTSLLAKKTEQNIEQPDEDGAKEEDFALNVDISRQQKSDHYEISGEVVVGLAYRDQTLIVKVYRANGLAAVHKNLSDPYVKIYLLPDMSTKKKTKTKKKTLDPSFDKTFKYKLSDDVLKEHHLWISVWSHGGIFKQNEFIGEVFIPFEFHKFDDSLQKVSYKLCDYTDPETIPMHDQKRKESAVYTIHTKGAEDETEQHSSSHITAMEEEAVKLVDEDQSTSDSRSVGSTDHTVQELHETGTPPEVRIESPDVELFQEPPATIDTLPVTSPDDRASSPKSASPTFRKKKLASKSAKKKRSPSPRQPKLHALVISASTRPSKAT